jgi:hypothetical protein
MKKTFPLKVPGREDQRVIEAVKNDVRKYVKRERRKALPAGVDFWDFACKVGLDLAAPETRHVAEIPGALEAAAKIGATEVYVEIIAIPGHRTKKPVPPGDPAPGNAPADAGVTS